MFGLSFEEEEQFHTLVTQIVMALALPTFLLLTFVVAAPWGKTSMTNFGTGIMIPSAKLAWVFFECPNLVWIVIGFVNRNTDTFATANAVLLGLYTFHYVNRTIIYPLVTMNTTSKPIPIEVALSAFFYTNVNGYIQAQSLCQFQTFPEDYTTQVSFLVGIVVFFWGFSINWQSDHILCNLRRKKETSGKQQEETSGKQESGNNNNKSHYKIPYGGWFDYVSAPHYFGEIVEWTGFWIACNFSLASLSFVIFTCSNLIPRGVSHHEWYKNHFKDSYPPKRTAVIPFLW